MESRDKNRILNFTIIVLVLIVLILAVLALIMPICIMYFAEEKYLVDKYKQNKHAFATVKTELLYMLEQENEDELVHRFVNNYTIHAEYFFESAGLKTQA